MDTLREQFPEIEVTEGIITIVQLRVRDRVLTAEVDGKDHCVLYDSANTEYDSGVYLEGHDHVAAVARFFRDQSEDAAGFALRDEAAIQDDAPQTSDFWDYLRAKADRTRVILVETYGNKFRQYKHHRVERRFNALVIASNRPRGVDLHTARGTDPAVQKAVESGRRFQEVMDNIVNTIERDGLRHIGIYCRAGHHRSVACAELLIRHPIRV